MLDALFGRLWWQDYVDFRRRKRRKAGGFGSDPSPCRQAVSVQAVQRRRRESGNSAGLSRMPVGIGGRRRRVEAGAHSVVDRAHSRNVGLGSAACGVGGWPVTWPVPSPAASPGLNAVAPPSSPTSSKWPSAKPTNRPSNASSSSMAAPRRRASSCRPVRQTTNCQCSKACGQINSAALPPMLEPNHGN